MEVVRERGRTSNQQEVADILNELMRHGFFVVRTPESNLIPVVSTLCSNMTELTQFLQRQPGDTTFLQLQRYEKMLHTIAECLTQDPRFIASYDTLAGLPLSEVFPTVSPGYYGNSRRQQSEEGFSTPQPPVQIEHTRQPSKVQFEEMMLQKPNWKLFPGRGKPQGPQTGKNPARGR